MFCGQVTPKNPQKQDSLSRTYRQFFFFSQKKFRVGVSEAFLIACWILQIPLLVDNALSLFTVPRDPVEKGKQKWPMAFSPGGTAMSYPTYWSMKQERERKIKRFTSSRCEVAGKKGRRGGQRCRFFFSEFDLPHSAVDHLFPQGLLSSSLMVTVFTSVYSASAYSPNSLPFPDILKPPNGACA